MKKRFLSWIKERLFLIIIVFLYSILAFVNLGDFNAPQTFEIFKPNEKFLIALPGEINVSDVMLYTGTTKNDFKSYYQIKNHINCFCESCFNNDLISADEEDFTNKKHFAVGGPFQWVRLKIDKATSAIMITPSKERDIAYGEVGVFGENSQKIEGIKIFKISGDEIVETTKISTLNDEGEFVPTEITAMNSMIFDELCFGQTAYQYANKLEGYETVHPPLGKILQAVPIYITGKMSPFTWRFMGTVAGIIIVIVVYYLALEIFKKKYFANIAVALISLSSLHFIQTRVGTVDSHLCLFTVLSFLFMFKFINNPKKMKFFALSGLFFGCAISVKWSGAFGGIGLAILFFANLKKLDKIWLWILKGVLFFIFLPLTIYCTSYLAFPETTQAESLENVYEQSVHLFEYHSGENTPHSASSPWFTWPISLVGFPFYASEDGTKTIGLFENYVIAYTSVIALVVSIYYAIKKHDKVSIQILIAYLSLLLPYAFISRPMFLYHYLPASIFGILAIANMIRKFPESKFLVRLIIASALISFIVLYPKMTGI